jgi:SAM-dependent methyltransferase
LNAEQRAKLLAIINNPRVQAVLYSRFLDYHQWSLLSFVKEQASLIKPGSSVLDAGAGELRYKRYFDHCQYKSNDLCVGDNEWYFDAIDIKSTIYDIPVKAESFDHVLCTQVLEHLEFPELAFKEFDRVLKPGGTLIVTVPLGQGEHQVPYDFYRYTRYALKSLGARNHLELTDIRSQGGIFINMQYMLWQAVSILTPFKKNVAVRYGLFIILMPVKFASGLIFNFLDIFDREKTYTNNYNCVYKKI